MPSYVSAPPFNVLTLRPGINSYAFGSLAVSQATVKGIVTSVTIASNVATIGVQIQEGNIPAAGQLITVVATSSDGGAANVQNVSINSVNINSLTGIGQIAYAATGTNQTVTADSGMFYIPVPEVGEALANGKSQAFAIQEVTAMNNNARTVTWSTSYPSAPAGVTMTLQASLVDIDAQYGTLDTSTATSGETRLVTLTNFRFLRVVASGVSGGSSPTVICKILI